jgi:pimeloyl-ACP methyl ester carboxylesterase
MNATISGVTTHYQLIGSSKQQPTLFLLHGWLCDWQIWSPVIAPLSESFRLVIPDLPAFGKSAAGSPTWDSQRYAEWLEAFITHIQETVGAHSPHILAGHSFGGKVAALYASQARLASPSLQHLLLIDAAGLPDPLPASKQLQKTFLGLIPSVLKKAVPTQLKERFLKATHSSTDHYQSNPAQKEVLKATIRENIADSLPHISLPTTIIWGANDQDTPVHQAHQFQKLIPNAHLHTFENAGHFPFIDDPARFVTVVKKSVEK